MTDFQAPPGQPANDPGRVLGLIGLILAIIPCTSGIGLILSIIGLVMSRSAGQKNTKALAGIVVAGVWIVLNIVAFNSGMYTTWMNQMNR